MSPSAQTVGAPVVLVTGGASGIGAATALAFAARGHRVAVNYRARGEAAQGVVAACAEAGAEACAVAGDVASDDDCRRMVAEVVARWGRLDVLVNNAGTTRFAAPGDLEALSAGDFAAIFAVNVSGVWQTTRAAAPHLRAARGAVVNVSSHAGVSGIGSSAAYAASKGALNTLTLSLARMLAPEVRVNAVCPGFVDTDWMAPRLSGAELEAFKRRAAAAAPLQQIVAPQEVAGAILWLGCDARAVTGQHLVIDAGTHLAVGGPMSPPADRTG